MHEYRRYVESEMDARHWTQADLARAAGLDRQIINSITKDTRDVLPGVPRMTTINGLAKAFTVKPETVLAHVALAMGLPVSVEQADVADLSDADLLMEVRKRMEARHDRQESEQGSEARSTEHSSEDRREDGSEAGRRQTPMSDDNVHHLDQGTLQPPPPAEKSAAWRTRNRGKEIREQQDRDE